MNCCSSSDICLPFFLFTFYFFLSFFSGIAPYLTGKSFVTPHRFGGHEWNIGALGPYMKRTKNMKMLERIRYECVIVFFAKTRSKQITNLLFNLFLLLFCFFLCLFVFLGCSDFNVLLLSAKVLDPQSVKAICECVVKQEELEDGYAMILGSLGM